MAAPVCTAAGLVTGCWNWDNFNPKQQLAIMIYAMAQELKGAGGTDYTGNLTGATAAGGLVYDAAQVFQTMTEDNRKEALVKIYLNNATGAGGSPPANPAAAVAAIKCLYNAKLDQLDQMFLWLTCQLGHHTGSN